MHIIDSHFHWWPRAVFERLCKRKDYPCWSPADALKYFAEIGLAKADQEKILYSNARRILNLRDPVQSKIDPPARQAVPA